MGEGTKKSGRGRGFCRAGVCCVAAILAAGESQARVAVSIPAQASTLAALGESSALPAAENLTFAVRDIEAQPGAETPIAIRLPSNAELRAAGAEDGAFVLIRNVPKGVSLSAGMSTGRIWVVPLREAAALRLLCKPEVNAPFQLGFHLIGPNNRALAQTTATVNVRTRETTAALPQAAVRSEPPKPAPAPPSAPVRPSPPAARPQPQADQLTPQAETVLLNRARELLQQGGVAAARLLFEELATQGSAAGALALARSFDPAFAGPPEAGASGPNLAEARKWYERAAELGNLDARRRLTEIASGR